jgi:hypothetical protein
MADPRSTDKRKIITRPAWAWKNLLVVNDHVSYTTHKLAQMRHIILQPLKGNP